jgi:secondary thiamine-phosphate synthase enzyme
MIKQMTITIPGQGLHEFTDRVQALVREAGLSEGLCTLFIRHTSASLLIQENADPAVRHDLEHWLNRLVPEDDARYSHRNEGPDDMPGHIKAALTATTLTIPISDGRLALGQWQGIFLWEHRHRGGERQVVVHIGGA